MPTIILLYLLLTAGSPPRPTVAITPPLATNGDESWLGLALADSLTTRLLIHSRYDPKTLERVYPLNVFGWRQALAAARGLTLMVDHTFLYTGAVRKIREIIDAGQLGRVLYFDSVRINLGLFQPDFNVVWDLAPHDLSILDYVLGRQPRWVSAIGASHYDTHENLAFLTIGFDDELLAHIHVNWVAPVKTRRITIAGTERMLVYDDTQPAERVKLYESGVDVQHLDREITYRMNIQYRTGDVLSPKLDPREALRLVVEDFARSCQTGAAPTSSGATGTRVVRLLEAAQRSLQGRGARIEL